MAGYVVATLFAGITVGAGGTTTTADSSVDGVSRGYTGPQQVARLWTPTRAAFAKYAIAGIPVVVPRATVGWPLNGMSCEQISEDFAAARMRMEYMQHDEAGDAGEAGEAVKGGEVGRTGEDDGDDDGDGDGDGDDDDGGGGSPEEENPQSIGDKRWMTLRVPSGSLDGSSCASLKKNAPSRAPSWLLRTEC